MLFLSRVFYSELESTKDGISLSELGKKVDALQIQCDTNTLLEYYLQFLVQLSSIDLRCSSQQAWRQTTSLCMEK